MAIYTIQYGSNTIEYELIYSRRKTLGINIYPDRRVIVRAPHSTSLTDVQAIVLKKAGWINGKLQEFDANPPPPPRRYVNGEPHLYLGRSYKLKVCEDNEERVELDGGHLHLYARDTKENERKQNILLNWYRQQANIIFPTRLAAVYPLIGHLGIPYPQMRIRLMKTRWGSCSTKGNINLNLRLIQTPIPCIDYVILHELAHFKEHNHSRAYYDLLDQLLPDWRDRREELNRIQIS